MSEEPAAADTKRVDSDGWLSLDEFHGRACRYWRTKPLCSHDVYLGELRRRFEGHDELARKLGGEMEFQDLDPERGPGRSARMRLTLPSGNRVVFEGVGDLLDWMVANRPELRALALRQHLSSGTPRPKESRGSRGCRSL